MLQLLLCTSLHVYRMYRLCCPAVYIPVGTSAANGLRASVSNAELLAGHPSEGMFGDFHG